MADKVEGLDQLLKQVGRIGEFPKEMSKELRKANRSIGSMASKKVKPQVPRSRRVFKVRRSGARGGKRGPWTSNLVRCAGPSESATAEVAALTSSSVRDPVV